VNIHAIIHEQIDWDGTIKSFQLKERDNIGDLWIAFPGDYNEPRNGPFYFLDHEYETYFQDKIASCRHIGIAPGNFYRDGEDYIFKTEWHRVPTLRNHLTYYALYLPEFAIPTEIVLGDPYSDGKEFSRTVFRDDEKNRFVIYIECSSKYGIFSFDLFSRFHRDEDGFKHADYSDKNTVGFYKHLNPFDWFQLESDKQEVNKFFIQTAQIQHQVGDTYHVNQAGAVGPGSSASNNTFNQQVNSLPENTDYGRLSEELGALKKHLRSSAESPEQFTAIATIADAEEAAKKRDGSKIMRTLASVGKWAFDAATEIGTDIAAEVIKKSMGI